MRCVRVLLGTAGAVLLASSAFAADFAALPPPVWTGFYCGGGGGYDWGKFDIDNHIFINGNEDQGADPPNSPNDPHWTPVSATASGPFATVICGYDQQVGSNFVFGVFANYDFQDKRGSFEHSNKQAGPWQGVPDLQNKESAGQRWDVGIGNMGTVAVRAGVLPTPELLLFGLVGWSWTEGSLSFVHGCIPTCQNLTGSGSKALNGLTLGAGIEALLGSNWSGRFEYRYTDLGRMSVASTWEGGPSIVATTNARITDQSVRAMLVYRP